MVGDNLESTHWIVDPRLQDTTKHIPHPTTPIPCLYLQWCMDAMHETTSIFMITRISVITRCSKQGQVVTRVCPMSNMYRAMHEPTQRSIIPIYQAFYQTKFSILHSTGIPWPKGKLYDKFWQQISIFYGHNHKQQALARR